MFTLLTTNKINDLPMIHKRKRSLESLPEALISTDHPTKVPKVYLEDAIQDSGSLEPSTSFKTSASGTLSSLGFSEAALHQFPLSRGNLRCFNRNNKAMASTPANKSQITQTFTTSISETLLSEVNGLKLHSIHIDDSDAERRGAGLIEKARAIVTGKRHSALRLV